MKFGEIKELSNVELNGVVRSFDKVGRISIPKEFRDKLDMDENDSVEIICVNDVIIVKKVNE